ncbi:MULTISPECIES: hypothetical protein [unclassified Dyella]|jgi:enoyl-[acyl-carrier-protein] reductase (NADH)|uniref:hypothetical protein n=1 Tax=unclassified Dyella TaxID=2634549 RepID=UPI003F8EBE22
MNTKALITGIVLATALALPFASMAQEGGPVVDIGYRHGNLRNAQQNIVQAWQLVSDAQIDNDDRLGGHAARAKALLTQADEELRLAADAANRNRW